MNWLRGYPDYPQGPIELNIGRWFVGSKKNSLEPTCGRAHNCEVMQLQYGLVRIDGTKKQGEPIQLK